MLRVPRERRRVAVRGACVATSLSVTTSIGIAVLVGAAVGGALPVAAGQAGAPMSKAEEMALAEGAGPPALAAEATLWVLGERGYEVAREGSNGASCLVSRDRVDTLEPICFDAEGTRAILPVYLERARLRAAGLDDEIEGRIRAGFESGRFSAPSKPGIAYMLSEHNRVFNGREVISYPPHIMVYAPYATNADIGADMSDPFLPWVLNEGDPHAYIIVVTGGR